jgi:hypothetical protein
MICSPEEVVGQQYLTKLKRQSGEAVAYHSVPINTCWSSTCSELYTPHHIAVQPREWERERRERETERRARARKGSGNELLLNQHRRAEPLIGACTAIGFLWISVWYLTSMIIFRRIISVPEASMRPSLSFVYLAIPCTILAIWFLYIASTCWFIHADHLL